MIPVSGNRLIKNSGSHLPLIKIALNRLKPKNIEFFPHSLNCFLNYELLLYHLIQKD